MVSGLVLSSKMQSKQQKMVASPSPSQTETQLNGFQSTNAGAIIATTGSCGRQCSPYDSETFYIKLTELLESTGLSLIFNVRETLLDLYLFYLEVTRRGGYLQVGREKKWGEVVSALKLEGSDENLSAQIEKLYSLLLFQFELLYFYRAPAKKAAASSTIGPATQIGHDMKRKRNSTACLSEMMDIEDGQMLTKVCKAKDYSCQMTGAGFVEQQMIAMAPSNDKIMKKPRGAPRGQRTAYQIFIKQECARLKTSIANQASDRPKILHTAINAWKMMSEIEKQPYVDQSKKLKESFKEARITYNKQLSMQNTSQEKRPNLFGDANHVTLQPQAESSRVKMTEKAFKDPSLLMNLNAYCSLDLSTEESRKL